MHTSRRGSGLKKLLSLTVVILTITTSWCQVTVTGTIIDKMEKLPLPGVTVIEKGTENGTATNADGKFSIIVNDPNATIVFLFVGYQKQEFQLKGATLLAVALKSDCNKDFFDSYHLALYLNSGLVHTPVGGQVEMSSPYTSIGVFKGHYSYQTNPGENKFQTAHISLNHPISTCEFDVDFRWSYRNVSFNKHFQSAANSMEAQLNLTRISLIAGYSHLESTQVTGKETKASSGILVGLEKELYFRPVVGTLSAKVAMSNSSIEYQAEYKGGFRWFKYFVRYYKLASFDEISLGAGAQISYYKKRRTPGNG